MTLTDQNRPGATAPGENPIPAAAQCGARPGALARRLLPEGPTLGGVAALIHRLVPAAALFSLFFVMDGGLEWLGLLGLIPLALAFHQPRCACGGPGLGGTLRGM